MPSAERRKKQLLKRAQSGDETAQKQLRDMGVEWDAEELTGADVREAAQSDEDDDGFDAGEENTNIRRADDESDADESDADESDADAQLEFEGMESDKDKKLEKLAKRLDESKKTYAQAGKDVQNNTELLKQHMHSAGTKHYKRGKFNVKLDVKEKIVVDIESDDKVVQKVNDALY